MMGLLNKIKTITKGHHIIRSSKLKIITKSPSKKLLSKNSNRKIPKLKIVTEKYQN